MFRSRINGRLIERYERRICTELCGRRANGTERCFALAAQKDCAASTRRGYATTPTPTSSRISQSAAKAINRPPPGSASSTRISGTSSTTTATAAVAEGSTSAAALRTAEARESALRAARMRRQAQKQDREEEAAKKREEEKEYKRKYNTAARKWVSSIIALPIFFVTSYYLFDRLALGNQPKSLEKHREEKS